VVAYTEKFTVADPELVVVAVEVALLVTVTPVVAPEEDVIAFVCSASADLAPTVALKTPPDTVYELPEQLVPLIGPV